MNERGNAILKDVSRSFYLSLRLLPAPMREAASVAYLLARASDTIADTVPVPVEVRLKMLSDFEHCLNHAEARPQCHRELLDEVSNFGERHLLEELYDVLTWMRALPEGERRLVHDVVTTIVSGQRFDLEYFSSDAKALVSADDLDDYTWRVAGCVGEFWTKLGYHTMGDDFSSESEGLMVSRGIAYGKGLQLINILRDLPNDLKAGRCYLPVVDLNNRSEILEAHRVCLDKAADLVSQGIDYAEQLKGRRLQVASVLPAMLGMKTLSLMQQATWAELEAGVKVSRPKVYLYLLSAFLGIFHVARSLEFNRPNG